MKVHIYNGAELSNKKAIFDVLQQCSCNSPYQYYNWLMHAYNESSKNPLKFFDRKVKIAELDDNGVVVALGAIVVKKHGNAKGIMFLGYDTASDYLDFLLSSGVKSEDIIYFIEEILRQTHCKQFYFSGLRTESLTYQALKNSEKFSQTGRESCVEIVFTGDTFEEYWNTMRKSVRQNIRTARNRLRNDGKTGEFILLDHSISREKASEIQNLYEQRRAEQNACRTGLKYTIYKIKRKLGLRKYNYLLENMVQNPDSVIILYKIDGEIAAFGHGLKADSGKKCFMQVSFDGRFRRYSPGMLMFCDYFYHLMEEHHRIDVDLTVGTEQYKYDLGGRDHEVVSGIYVI